jgi:hypothetical protein
VDYGLALLRVQPFQQGVDVSAHVACQPTGAHRRDRRTPAHLVAMILDLWSVFDHKSKITPWG